jgi:phage/plasmid-like protein (TIGR03299 family)
MTAAEVIEITKLDWLVGLEPLYLRGGTCARGVNAIVRRDKANNDPACVIGTCGNGYCPVQNIDAFKFFDPVVSNKEAIYHTAGVLKGGRYVWLMARLPSKYWIRVVNNDWVTSNILLVNCHTGSHSILAALTHVQVVCNNTLNLAIEDIFGSARPWVKIRHTKNVLLALREAHKVLGLATSKTEIMREALCSLAHVPLTASIWEALKRIVIPSKSEESGDQPGQLVTKKRGELDVLLDDPICNTDPEQTMTCWTGLNAVTYWADHIYTPQKRDRQAEFDRGYSALFGTSSSIKTRALKWLIGKTE